jgi:FkbM family methyltransferase
MKDKLKSILSRFFSLLPLWLIQIVESSAGNALGKGLGASKKDKYDEVYSCLRLYKTQRDKHLVVFDIGANIGEWTDSFLEIYSNIHLYLFEPQRLLYENLIRKYDKSKSITIVHSAIGQKHEWLTLYSDKTGSGLASLVKRNLNHFGIDFEAQELVPVIDLDSFCIKNSVWPDIVKMDLEGYELLALMGGRKALKNVKVCQFEFGGANIDSRTFFRDFYLFFKELDFEIYRNTLKGLQKLTNYDESYEKFAPTNYFAVNINY